MPDSIQPAPTGRSQCRGCGRKIAGGEPRFGESLPSAYREGEALHWFHLSCAACMRPEKLLPCLDGYAEPVPDRDWLRGAAEAGMQHRRLPRLCRVERASSGRARCRSCREVIAAGTWRLALQIWEEGRFNAAGFLHLSCAEAYLGTAAILDRLQRTTPELDADALREIEDGLRGQRPAPQGEAEGPSIAKTLGHPEAERKTRG